MQDALLSNQVDAIVTLEPFIAHALEDSRIKVLGYPDVEIEPGYAGSLWVGRENWVKEHPAATRKFVWAIYHAVDYLNQNPDQRFRLMAEWTGLSEDLLRRTAPDVFDTSMPTASLEWQGRMMKKSGWIQSEINITQALWTLP